MARSSVAEARRSQLVSTYGIGALFPAEDESFMLVGLDDWDERYCPEVTQPRLARSMGVRTFRMPPSGGRGAKDVPVVRFPRMHHCPSCHRLDYLNKFCGWDEHRCHDCQRTLTPSRFVICCPNGHIDDFPYFAWVHRGQEFAEGNAHRLSMRTRGQSSSLKDIVVSCSCGVPSRTMAGSFGPQAMGGIVNCHGQRPWIRNSPEQDCEHLPRTLQRGSSNVWFASVRSALSIPPWSEGVHKILGQYWPVRVHDPRGVARGDTHRHGDSGVVRHPCWRARERDPRDARGERGRRADGLRPAQRGVRRSGAGATRDGPAPAVRVHAGGRSARGSGGRARTGLRGLPAA